MTRRGLQLGGEFRYLEPGYSGEATLEILPNDRVADRSRYLGIIAHRQQFTPRASGSLHYERVSDDTYFTDLSSLVSKTSQVNLLREGNLAYDGGWWQAAARVQDFQTLQDPAAPVAAPYQRLPQVTLNARQSNLTQAG